MRTKCARFNVCFVITILLSVLLPSGPSAHAKKQAPKKNSASARAAISADPTTPCDWIKILPSAEINNNPALQDAALLDATKRDDISCLAHVALLRTAQRNCTGAVQVAESALARSKADPLAHLALAVAKQCVISKSVAGSLQGRPLQCSATIGPSFNTLVRGALLTKDPEAPHFAAAATVELARFCRDDDGLLLSLAQVLGRGSATALGCALEKYERADAKQQTQLVTTGLTGWLLLCEAEQALRERHTSEAMVLHHQLTDQLDEALVQNETCLSAGNSSCVSMAQGLLFAAGQLALRPETAGFLLEDLGKLSRRGGLRIQVLQFEAVRALAAGPLMTPAVLRSSAELKDLEAVHRRLEPHRDGLEAALLRLGLRLITVLGARPDPCDQANQLAAALADFAPASQTTPNVDLWKMLAFDVVNPCLSAAKRCPTATLTEAFCREFGRAVEDGRKPVPPEFDFAQGETVAGQAHPASIVARRKSSTSSKR